MAEELNEAEWQEQLLALVANGPERTEAIHLVRKAVRVLQQKDTEIARLRYLWPKNGLGQDVDIRQLMANHRSWTQQAGARADEAEDSRQAWAEEAMTVREKLERLENMVLNRSAALFSGILVGVGGENDTPPKDEQTWRAVDLIERAIRREMGPGYITQAEERLVSAVESNGVCVCVIDVSALDSTRWSVPQCAVHERDMEGASDA